ncbi:MAG: 4-hydroxy-tetrahydrodipicolinate reductase [Propionibacteriaceae bacterium]|jgi:4-hydroxy-tetrahydrodipicolinate reductase|nr:4-hydroxy-tetrahydrodipicolinate reductase [Propionibacteriaceae bacterium]
MLKVAVFGAKGRMGARIVAAVQAAPDLELHAAIDAGDPIEAALGADVAIDFTVPAVVMEHIEWCIASGIACVVGTTGFDEQRYEQVRSWVSATPGAHVLIASNFSVAAVLMIRFAALAAPYFESVEIVELHHPAKLDAPSGTAITTAKAISAARAAAECAPMPDATATQLAGARGASVADTQVHSIRLSGLFAHQEVLLGNPGELLTIRDDSFDRSSYLPGILLAVRQIQTLPGLTLGIDSLL